MPEDKEDLMPIERLESNLKEYIDQRDTAVEQRIKLWVVTAVLAQVITFLPIIFFLGGIYSTTNQALSVVQTQQDELVKRGDWMKRREVWEQAVEQWAEPKGFKPPRSSATN